MLIVAFNFAKGRGYCMDNPAEQSARQRRSNPSLAFLPFSRPLACWKAPRRLVPYVGIGAFAGLRRAELERLTGKKWIYKPRLIEVAAAKAKSARRRFVKIQPNLAKWLRPRAQLSGNVRLKAIACFEECA